MRKLLPGCSLLLRVLWLLGRCSTGYCRNWMRILPSTCFGRTVSFRNTTRPFLAKTSTLTWQIISSSTITALASCPRTAVPTETGKHLYGSATRDERQRHRGSDSQHRSAKELGTLCVARGEGGAAPPSGIRRRAAFQLDSHQPVLLWQLAPPSAIHRRARKAGVGNPLRHRRLPGRYEAVLRSRSGHQRRDGGLATSRT